MNGAAAAGRKRCTYKLPTDHVVDALLPLSEFGVARSNAAGLNYWCRSCIKQANHRARHADQPSAKSPAPRSTVDKPPAPPPTATASAMAQPAEQLEDGAMTVYEGDLAIALAELREQRRAAVELDDEDAVAAYDLAIAKLVRELIR